jgi:hypothetical protein
MEGGVMNMLEPGIRVTRERSSGMALLGALLALGAILGARDAAATETKLVGDTFVNAGSPGQNNGTGAQLKVGGSPAKSGLVSFDLSFLPASVTSADVARATLKIFVAQVSAAGSFDVRRVSGPWSESTVTFATMPALGGTEAAGVAVSSSALNTFIVVDVTAAVKSWIDTPSTNYGLALVASSGSLINVALNTKENTSGAHEAVLDVALTGPTGPQGLAGPAGAAGAQGPMGLQGPPGPFGPTGPAGAQGVAGLKGDTGAQGPQGNKGDVGPKGDKGDKGDPGSAGPGFKFVDANGQTVGPVIDANLTIIFINSDPVQVGIDRSGIYQFGAELEYQASDCSGPAFRQAGNPISYADGAAGLLYYAPVANVQDITVRSYQFINQDGSLGACNAVDYPGKSYAQIVTVPVPAFMPPVHVEQ